MPAYENTNNNNNITNMNSTTVSFSDLFEFLNVGNEINELEFTDDQLYVNDPQMNLVPVRGYIKKDEHELVRVTLQDGTTFEVSSKHLVFEHNECKFVSDCKSVDTINGNQLITSIESVSDSADVYDITIDNPHVYVTPNGVIHHNTTFMLQLLDGMDRNGYKTGYFSGEESIYQLAFTANRVNAKRVQIANMTDIDEICEYMTDLDFIVIDSFQALTSKTKMNSRQLEKYAVQTLTKRAKDTECTVVFIMHLTKSGELKGGTIVPHTVDSNLKIDRIDDVDNDGARVVYFEKNRFGPCNELETVIGPHGYDFDAVVIRDEESTTKVSSKADRKAADREALLDAMSKSPTGINISEASKLLEDNVNRAYNLLRELVTIGKANKDGRGTAGVWTLSAEELESREDNILAFAAQNK